MITSTFGAACKILFTIQLWRGKFNAAPTPLLRFLLHPGVREPLPEEIVGVLQGQLDYSWQRYQTRDGIELKGIWVERNPGGLTVVGFHANGEDCEGFLCCWGIYYYNLGYNLFMANYRGYESDSGNRAGPDQELEAYYDGEAALQFVQDQGIQKEHILAHGTSLGAAYAVSLAKHFNVPRLVLDHPFPSYAASIHKVAPLLSESRAQVLVEAAYRQHTTPFQTDGFNNERKLKALGEQVNVFVIQGLQDRLMPLDSARRLLAAVNQPDNLIELPGGHNEDISQLLNNEEGYDRTSLDRFVLTI